VVDQIEDEELRRIAARISTRLEVEHPDDPEEEWFTAEHRILPADLARAGDASLDGAVSPRA
jgi:hypothetical protein